MLILSKDLSHCIDNRGARSSYQHLRIPTPFHPNVRWARISCSVSSATDRFDLAQTNTTHINLYPGFCYLALSCVRLCFACACCGHLSDAT